jgi:hypothetical protein
MIERHARAVLVVKPFCEQPRAMARIEMSELLVGHLAGPEPEITTDVRFGLDYGQRGSPVGPESGEQDPEHPIAEP